MCLAENSLITTDSASYSVQKGLFEKLGDGACKLKNFTAAIGYYKKMLEAAEKCGGSATSLIPVYVSLYQTYKDMHEYESALEYMWKEYELCKGVHSEAYSTLMGIAETMDLARKEFWSVDDVYERAKKVAADNGLKRKATGTVMRQIALREKHNMTTLADIMKQELAGQDDGGAGEDDDGGDDDMCTSEEQNTPDIGDEIDLDLLTESGDETDSVDDGGNNEPRAAAVVDERRSARKRRSFAVKKNDKGESQLHRACISGNLAQARRLIEQGHPVNVRDHAGWQPLHEAANHGFAGIVELLLENGAAINDKGGAKCDGFTPLHDACGNGVLAVVEVLLDRNANATLRNDLGDTPLHTLIKWRQAQLLEPHEQFYYERLHERLREQLDKAGISVNAITAKEPKKTPTKKPRTTPRKRILSESSSAAEDNDMDSSEQFETVDNILSQEFPRAHSPAEAPHEDDKPDYRAVMSDLRHGNFQKKVDTTSDSFRAVEKKKKHAAMMAPDEVALDDWLEDDVGPSTKRRRLLGETKMYSNELNGAPSGSAKKVCGRLKLSGSSSSESNMVVSSTNNAVLSSDDSDEENAFNVLMSSNQSSLGRWKKRGSSSFGARKASADFLQQSNLIENGFQVHRSLSPEPFGSPVSSTVSSPHKAMPAMTPSVQSCSIKVQVADLFFNIAVNMNNVNDLTIEWLADEAAKRYYG